MAVINSVLGLLSMWSKDGRDESYAIAALICMGFASILERMDKIREPHD